MTRQEEGAAVAQCLSLDGETLPDHALRENSRIAVAAGGEGRTQREALAAWSTQANLTPLSFPAPQAGLGKVRLFLTQTTVHRG